jgi:uncharacterized membrane protein
MRATVRFVVLLALVVWVGEIVFLSAVVAPAVFGALPRDVAGRALSAIFPWYYRIGCVAGVALITGAALAAATSVARRRWLAVVAVGGVMLGMTAYAAVIVRPRVEALRPQLAHGAESDPRAQAEFDRLHRQAVTLNGLTLACGLAVVGLTAGLLRD